MPARKKTETTTSVSASKEKSDRLVLAEAISKFTKKQADFLDAYEDIKSYKNDLFRDLDTEIETKRKELDELSVAYAKEDANQRIDCDISFKQYKYDTALDVLTDRAEEPISIAELASLREELAELKSIFKKSIEEAISKEKAHGEKSLHSAINACKLQNQAEVAEIKAMSKQKQEEVISLLRSLETLKSEIAEQRKLTQSVAEAGRAAPISQSFAK
jgi:hypothetical protein